MDGNRTQDVYSLRPGGTASSACFPGTCTAKYSYDPRDRLVSQDDGHGNLTSYSLDGAGNILSQAKNGTTTVTNTYNGQEHRHSLGQELHLRRQRPPPGHDQHPYTNGQPGTPTTSTYGYDTHGSVSQLVDPNGKTTASYGYTPFGQSDSQVSQGDTDKTTPTNPFRFSGKRVDTGSGILDMGVRRFGPDTSQFLTPAVARHAGWT